MRIAPTVMIGAALVLARPAILLGQVLPGDGEDPCDGCAIVFFLGVPVYSFCIDGGGGALMGCVAHQSPMGCSGQSCNYALKHVKPLIDRLVRDGVNAAGVERAVAAFGEWVSWASDGRTLECALGIWR